jgi:hypothetical protein
MLLAALVLQAASTWSVVGAADEGSAAFRPYLACLAQQAAQIDDHRSDAATVAIAIEHLCVEEAQGFVDALSEGADAETVAAIHRNFDEQRRAYAIRAVLMSRRRPQK